MKHLEESKYLGIYFTSNGATERAMRRTLSLGQKSIGRMNKLCKDRIISLHFKVGLLE